MSAEPLISVLMPAFDAEDTISRAICSVLDQSMNDLELIIVNDAARDRTRQRASYWARHDTRITLLNHETQSGAAAARNSALNAARGRFIAFLDADDEWMPSKLEAQVAAMRSQDVALCYGAFYREHNGRRKLVSVPQTVTYPELLRGNVIGCLTAIYDRARFGKVPMKPLRLRQDYALWLDLLKRTEFALGLSEPLAIHHRHPRSLSSSLIANAAGTWKLYRNVEHKSLGASAYYLLSHYANRWRSIR